MKPDNRQESDLQNLQQIVAGLSEGVILIDPDQTLRWVNDAALVLHGVTSIEELGRDVTEYRERFRLRYRDNHQLESGRYPVDRVVAGETFAEVVVEVTPSGSDEPRWVHQVRSMVMTDGRGAPERLVLVIQDVTLRFQAEDRFEQAFNADPAPALVCRLSDHRIVKVNEGFLEMTGLDGPAVLSRSVYELDLFNGADQRDDAKARLHDGRAIPQMEVELAVADGGTRLVALAGQPIAMGTIPCMLFTMADLERGRRAETALTHSEARFDRMFQLAPIAMMVTAPDGRIEETNRAFQRLTGYPDADTIGRRADELQLWETGAIRRAMEAELKASSTLVNRDGRLRSAGGALIDCLISASVIEGGSNPCVLWVMQDISDRRSSEVELLASVEEVMKDAGWFSRALVEKLANLRTPPSSARHAQEISALTVRERQVLGSICQGADDAAIAARFGMSRNTVRNHVGRIYAKIGVNKRGAAIVWARERGLNHGEPALPAP